MLTLLNRNRIDQLELSLQRYKQRLAERQALDEQIAALVAELQDVRLVDGGSGGDGLLETGEASAPAPVEMLVLETVATEAPRSPAARSARRPGVRRAKGRRVLTEEHKQKIGAAMRKRHRERRRAARA